MKLTAYKSFECNLTMVPASQRRQWMNDTIDSFANNCLPLLMANSLGWQVMLDEDAIVSWDGGERTPALTVQSQSTKPPLSNFGHGIITWQLPWLFRTEPGWNLLVTGPHNFHRDGIVPMSGLVETDWAVQSFTMNWQLTRPGTVKFDKGTPIAQLMPVQRGVLESIDPEEQWIYKNPALQEQHEKFADKRRRWTGPKRDMDYFKGLDMDGNKFKDHQTKAKGCPFHREV